MKKQVIILIAALLLIIGGCGKNNNSDHTTTTDNGKSTTSHESNHENSEMNHSGSGEVPEGLQVASNPKFKVGDKAIIKANHMEGMEGAEATIVGAYNTIAYVVTYTPTTGGNPVKNHKWVIQEEIENADKKALPTGTEVTLLADHMEGMKGAKAVIESAEATTVYMVDYTPTTGGPEVKNHKWVTESELTEK